MTQIVCYHQDKLFNNLSDQIQIVKLNFYRLVCYNLRHSFTFTYLIIRCFKLLGQQKYIYKPCARKLAPMEISEVLILTRAEMYRRGHSLEPCTYHVQTGDSLVTHLGVLMTISSCDLGQPCGIIQIRRPVCKIISGRHSIEMGPGQR